MFRKQNSSQVIVYIILWFIDIRFNEMLLTLCVTYMIVDNCILEENNNGPYFVYQLCFRIQRLFVKEYIKMKSSDTS